MTSSIQILQIYPESFRANLYSRKPFRMIGLIDVSIQYSYGRERVTFAYFRSSGTNLGKIEGLWYPIVGIKMHSGKFTEFTEYLNFVLTKTAIMGSANKRWLAKSVFFAHTNKNSPKIRGFSNGIHYGNLLKIGKLLRLLYQKDNFHKMDSLDARKLNSILTSNEIYPNNWHTQRENFERFIEDIYNNKVPNL